MNQEADRANFQRDGFAVFRGFLSSEELQSLQAELDRYVRDVVPHLGPGEAFYQDRTQPETLKQLQRMAREPFFDAYRKESRWVELAESLLGEQANADEPEWFNKPPGSLHPTPPHQDNHYFQLTPPQVLTMWLALDTVDEENGCLRYVRGSHQAGRRPHSPSEIVGFSQQIADFGPDDVALETMVCLAPGDLVVHHGETIHRAEANKSADRNRRAFALVFRGASCRVDEAARAAYRASLQAQHERSGLASAAT